MSINQRLSATWVELKSQWQSSAPLRLGSVVIALILVVLGLQLGLDYVSRQRERLRTVETELARLRTLVQERTWPERAKLAAQQSAAMSSMAWAESDLGLTEAAFQDWLRNVPAKLGLKTRELNLGRLDDSKVDVAKPGSGPDAGKGLALPSGHGVLRARISFELQRGPLFAFLAECARSERSVVVERLSLRSQSQPPVAELELRALARKLEVKP
jgi:hypothetical protein